MNVNLVVCSKTFAFREINDAAPACLLVDPKELAPDGSIIWTARVAAGLFVFFSCSSAIASLRRGERTDWRIVAAWLLSALAAALLIARSATDGEVKAGPSIRNLRASELPSATPTGYHAVVANSLHLFASGEVSNFASKSFGPS
jgi:hypothetical protein